MRTPGMTFFRMPLFVWATFVTAILLVLAIPALTVAVFMVMFERIFNIGFFTGVGGDPLLYQHLFWFFGHPEVYVLILPAFGIISEILPVFSRKPIFGYKAIAYSSASIGGDRIPGLGSPHVYQWYGAGIANSVHGLDDDCRRPDSY